MCLKLWVPVANLQQDTFWTHPSLGMHITGGTIALRGAKLKRNAAVVDMVIATMASRQDVLKKTSYLKQA